MYLHLYYMAQALRGPITKINQSKCSIAGPIFSKYWTGHCPKMIPHFRPVELEIKMADEDKIFRKCRHIAPELTADIEKPCFSLELEIFKSRMTDGEPAPAVETPSTRKRFPPNITWNLGTTFKAFFSGIINLLLTKLAWDRTGRISALSLFCSSVHTVKTSGQYFPSTALVLGY